MVKERRCGVLPSGTCCLSICPPLCLRLCLIGVPPGRNPSQRDCGLREEEQQPQWTSDVRREAGGWTAPASEPGATMPLGQDVFLSFSFVLLHVDAGTTAFLVHAAAWLG